MKQYFPDKKCLLTLRILVTIAAFLLIMIVNFFFLVKILMLLTDIIIAAAAIFVMFAYLPLLFSSMKYISTDTEIIRSSGVFIKTHQSVRYSSIQYTTVVSTPFSQYTGLNFIVFFVYGGQLQLMFLDQKDVQEILKRAGTEGAV